MLGTESGGSEEEKEGRIEVGREREQEEGGSDGRREVSDLEEEHVLRRNEDVGFGYTNLEMPPVHWFGPPTFQSIIF